MPIGTVNPCRNYLPLLLRPVFHQGALRLVYSQRARSALRAGPAGAPQPNYQPPTLCRCARFATLCAGNVREVRTELEPLEPHYSPGLIWVGREAQAGAQISVSDVRGDVVLWLDGAALGATAFVKDGVRRSCCFLHLQQVG